MSSIRCSVVCQSCWIYFNVTEVRVVWQHPTSGITGPQPSTVWLRSTAREWFMATLSQRTLWLSEDSSGWLTSAPLCCCLALVMFMTRMNLLRSLTSPGLRDFCLRNVLILFKEQITWENQDLWQDWGKKWKQSIKLSPNYNAVGSLTSGHWECWWSRWFQPSLMEHGWEMTLLCT